MKGGLEKYLFFNTLEARISRPRDESGETDEATRKAAAEEAVTASKVYHPVFKGITATSGDVAAGDNKVIKVRGIKGIKAGGANVGDIVNIVDRKRNYILTSFIQNHVVASVNTTENAAGYFEVTLVAAPTNALDYSADVVANANYTELWQGHDDKNNDNIYYEFTGNDGSDGKGDDKDVTVRAQQVCYPVERFKGYMMESQSKEYEAANGRTRAAGKGVLVMVFEPLLGSPAEFEDSTSEDNWDYIYLAITAGKQKEVMRDISNKINGHRNLDDGFIVVFDDIEKEKVSPHILAIASTLAPNK